MKPKAPFKLFLNDIIPETSQNSLTSETTFLKSLLIVYVYSKIPNLYGKEIITSEEVMDNLVMSQTRFSIIDEFGEWDL